MRNLSSDIYAFYIKRDYQCAWFNEYGLTEQSGKIVNLIGSYIQSGIMDSSVLIPGVVGMLDSLSMEPFNPVENDTLLLRADITMTAQFLKFSDKAWKGMPEKKLKELEWFLPVKKPSRVEYLDFILTHDMEKGATEPVSRPYLRLVEKVKKYSAIEKDGGWKQISPTASRLKPGDTSEVILNVRKRLALTGDFIVDTTRKYFDNSFASVVVAARNCFGLSADTVIDNAFITELNVPVEDRLRQMLINAERWKWIPANPDSNFIAVNIPEYMLHVFENGTNIKDMKVIVGKDVSKTVIFSGKLKHIVFSPYWIIPKSIIAEETLPALQENPGYLAAHNMEIVSKGSPSQVIPVSKINFSKYSGDDFPYTIRQKPGESNSLGRVKFLFPNNFSIYLHDTPAKNLFKESSRSFSHGCIRISDPAWMAEYLLRNNPQWPEEKIHEAMHADHEIWVNLETPIPVYITYFTSWVDKYGYLNFRKDIYGHDDRLEQELFN